MPPKSKSKFNIDRIRKKGDAVMEGGLETDVVILVMGPTGSGKSTFLKNFLSVQEGYTGPIPDVSHGLESCTKTLAAYITSLPTCSATPAAQRLVLVDTPGFDDTCVSDSEILRKISVWLASSYGSEMKVGGIIYMFPIYPNRITRNDKANLKVFQRLCGDHSLGKVHMVTTKWALLTPTQVEPIGAKREEQLKQDFWKDMVAGGSRLSRLYENSKSAQELFDVVFKTSQQLNAQCEMALALQEEIVSKLKTVPGTEAGQELKRKLQELLKEHKAACGDYDTRQQKLQNIANQLRDLKMPFGERFRAFFGLA